MSCSIDLLKHRYLKNIKKNAELYVGIELEYPVVNLEGDATDVEVIKHLFRYLVFSFDLTVEKVDDFGNPIQLVKMLFYLKFPILRLSLHLVRLKQYKRLKNVLVFIWKQSRRS